MPVDEGAVRVLGAWQGRVPGRNGDGAAAAPGFPPAGAEVAVPAAGGGSHGAARASGAVPQVVGVMPPVPDWPGVPSLDEPAFPALVLVLLGLFVVITGRGDRRDPKLVRADLDARERQVGFS